MKHFLLLGAGTRRDRELTGKDWSDGILTTNDINPAHAGIDVVHDLNVLPWPWQDDTFDEVHAYEVLEHLGTQGDWRYFFASFSEVWRILKMGGLFVATVPWWQSEWAWGDPSHTRVLPPGCLHFLAQENYKQVGATVMSDFRFIWKRNLTVQVAQNLDNSTFRFVLRKEE